MPHKPHTKLNQGLPMSDQEAQNIIANFINTFTNWPIVPLEDKDNVILALESFYDGPGSIPVGPPPGT